MALTPTELGYIAEFAKAVDSAVDTLVENLGDDASVTFGVTAGEQTFTGERDTATIASSELVTA